MNGNSMPPMQSSTDRRCFCQRNVTLSLSSVGCSTKDQSGDFSPSVDSRGLRLRHRWASTPTRAFSKTNRWESSSDMCELRHSWRPCRRPISGLRTMRWFLSSITSRGLRLRHTWASSPNESSFREPTGELPSSVMCELRHRWRPCRRPIAVLRGGDEVVLLVH